MTVISQTRETHGDRAPIEAGQLAFGLSFAHGKGLLTSRDVKLGPFDLQVLELEIPNISFPFDVTGGAERFKNRRCELKRLSVAVSGEAVAQLVSSANAHELGFVDLKTAMRDGHIELAGRLISGSSFADFTLRVALLPRSPDELAIVFYDTRVYGSLPLPAPLVPTLLRRALDVPFAMNDERPTVWVVKPGDKFVRTVMPLLGWKVPDTSRTAIAEANISRGQLSMTIGPQGEPNDKQKHEHKPPADAVLAHEGVSLFDEAERALGAGKVQEAYELYRTALDDERGSAFVRERLLQIGASEPDLALETRMLADEMLAVNPHDVQALLALAGIALRERSYGDASNRFEKLGEIARHNRARFDAIAAELASAGAAAPIDKTAAIAGYERAAARARDSVVAHRALFDLLAATGELDRALKAGDRLSRLERHPSERAKIYKRLGLLARQQLGDLKKARIYYERALKLAKDDPEALEGLAETYAARGEPARAATYLARLAEQAEESGDGERIVALNLRLGEIWERWLDDIDSASQRYLRVLDIAPRHRVARLRLAEMAEKSGDRARARQMLEELVALDDESEDPTLIREVALAYTRLARIVIANEGMTAHAIASLERAVELAPHLREARDQLSNVLRERGDWSRLIELLAMTARGSTDASEVKRARLEAARLELEERHDQRAALVYLDDVLDSDADDADALELALPILHDQSDFAGILERASAAADTTLEPTRKAQYLLELANAREALGMDPESRRRALEDALDANPYLLEAAETLVRLLDDYEDHERLVRALGRLAVATNSPDVRAEALLRQGRLLWQQLRRPHDAEDALREAVRLEPGNFATWTALSRLLEAIGKLDDAREVLERAVAEADRRNVAKGPLYERAAELARVRDDAEEEARQLLLAVSAGQRTDKLGDRLVQVLSHLGRLREAATLLEEWAQEAARLGQADATFLFKAAELRRSMGEVDRASAIFRDLVQRRGEAALASARALEKLSEARNDWDSVVDALAYQIEVETDSGEVTPELLTRFTEAQARRKDWVLLERAAERLLSADPTSIVGHWHMAQCLLRIENFHEALFHLERIVTVPRPDDTRGGELHRTAFMLAAALATEIDPPIATKVFGCFAQYYPDEEASALAMSLGDILASAHEWTRLLALRRVQLERADEPRRTSLKRQIATILNVELGRSDESIPFYQDVIANMPHDIPARDALVHVFEKLGRWGDLASHLFALSQVVEDAHQALDYGLASVEIYMNRVLDVPSARQVLRTLIESQGLDPNSARLVGLLRELEMDAELAHVLSMSLEKAPDANDGRLHELVDLVENPLEQPETALDWAQRYVVLFPDEDAPREIAAQLYERHPELGEVRTWLERWAREREGARRAAVLVRLADYLRGAGKDDDAHKVLEKAAEYDPTNVTLLTRLVERSTARDDWQSAARWLEKLAFDVDASADEKQERLRRLVEVASDYAENTTLAIKALESLDARTDEEEHHLAELYVQADDVAGIRRMFATVRGLASRQLLTAAKALAHDGDRTAARELLDSVIDRGEALDVWPVAETLWAEHRSELAEWRLRVADRTNVPAEAARLRIDAYTDLLAGGERVENADVRSAFDGLDTSDTRIAWAAFRLAKQVGDTDWQARTADALIDVFASDDERLPDLVHTRARLAHDADDHGLATRLARRLIALGDTRGEALLDAALEASGDVDALVETLAGRAGTKDAQQAAALWMRIVGLETARDSDSAARAALERIHEDERDLAWGTTMHEVATRLGDSRRQVESAKTVARFTADEVDRADWLRTAARLAWWELGDEETGHALLVEAQDASSESAGAVLERANTHLSSGEPDVARRALNEGLAVFKGESAVGLWLRLADVEEAAGNRTEATRALERTMQAAGEDAALFVAIAERAERVLASDLALGAYASAMRLDAQYEDLYLQALERAQRWDKVIVVLEGRASELTGAAAAERLSRAATIAGATLNDDARALVLLMQASQLHATESTLRPTFELARKLAIPDIVAQIGQQLEPYMDGASDALEIARIRVQALEQLGRGDDTAALRERLVAGGDATSADLLELARLLADSAPDRAALYLRQAALHDDLQQEPELLVRSAMAFDALGDVEEARPLIAEALERGIDTLEAHELAYRLLSGESRLRSLTRLVSAGADAGWDDVARAGARIELADWYASQGALEEARLSLVDAAQYDKPAGWVQAIEAILERQGRELDLAQLWLEESTGQRSGWSASERNARVQRASEIYRDANDDAGEYRALEMLARVHPDDQETRERLMEVVAKLGDVEDFNRRVDEHIAQASGPGARAEVVLRYATVLDERFNQSDRAIRLALATFAELPSLEMARLLRHLMVRAGRAVDLATTLHARALTQPPPDDRALLNLAAESARTDARDESLMYRITRDVHARYPDDEAARDYVLAYAGANGLNADLVTVLKASAAAATDAEQAFGFLVRAAGVASNQLGDQELELQLLDMALGAQPNDPSVTERLFELRLARGELEIARQLFESQALDAERELASGLALLKAFGESSDEGVELSKTIADRHPSSAFAAQVRLSRARAEQDQSAVLREVETRLADPATSSVERIALHTEAGGAAFALGDQQSALEHFMAALETSDPSPDTIRRAAQIAFALGDSARSAQIMQAAAVAREQIITRVTSARGEDRVEWLYLLARAHEAANDTGPALDAYRQAVEGGSGPVNERAFEALDHLYKKRGEWRLVADAHQLRADRAAQTDTKAESIYERGRILKEYLFDEEGAEAAFDKVLRIAPKHPGAQLELGMLAYGKRNYAKATPLLSAQLEERGDEAPIDQWLALLDCLRELGKDDEALIVATRILARDPSQSDLRLVRADLLEAAGQADEAASELQAYLDAVQSDADADLIAGLHERLARHSMRAGDSAMALAHYESAYHLMPDSLLIIRGLRALHESESRWSDVVSLRNRELALTADRGEQRAMHLTIAKLHRERLNDRANATKHLEKAYELDKNDVDLARELFALHTDSKDGKKLLQVGERLIATAPPNSLDAMFYVSMGRAYDETQNDLERSKEMYAKALKLQPGSPPLEEAFKRLALATEDYAAWAPMEERALEALTDNAEASRRYQELADIVARHLSNPARAAQLMNRARELDPSDAGMTRRLADTYALDPKSYDKAAALYRELLGGDEFNTDLLKILARLSGQIGDTDRAYAYYASLLVLAPADAEAKRFVTACRSAVPQSAKRAVNDADRQAGLVHPDQLGAAEDLFAPLARFAELTHPGNLKLRGVDERDVLAATDERAKWLAKVMEPLGLTQAQLYLWRGGGFACEAELVGTPTILVGSSLATDASPRQRAFLVARTAELYRSGHTLCGRLPLGDLEALIASLVMALLQTAQAPGSGPSTVAWSNIISQPMTDQIRNALKARARNYVEKYAEVDVAKWRRACLQTAGRVALLLACDIDDAINAMLRLRGFDDITDEQRTAVLLESPEELDLFRFALSDAYFTLRESLGVALKKATKSSGAS